MQPVWYSRGYLPHCDGLSRQQFITYRMADSLPSGVVERWLREIPGDDQESERRVRIDGFLDAGHGRCLLSNPDCARIVEGNLLHFDGDRYRLLAWVVMPNHVHVLIEPLADHRLVDIIHSWKSFTATRINRRLRRSGVLWQREYWDRYIRDMSHLQSTMAYIHTNPVTARLVTKTTDWQFSSARWLQR